MSITRYFWTDSSPSYRAALAVTGNSDEVAIYMIAREAGLTEVRFDELIECDDWSKSERRAVGRALRARGILRISFGPIQGAITLRSPFGWASE